MRILPLCLFLLSSFSYALIKETSTLCQEPILGNKLIHALKEKDEGYCLETDEGHALIIQGLNKIQIDNEDVFLALIDMAGIDPFSKEVISRKPYEELPYKIRKKLFQRIQGDYELPHSIDYEENFLKKFYTLKFSEETKEPLPLTTKSKPKKIVFEELLLSFDANPVNKLSISNDRISFFFGIESNSRINHFIHQAEYQFAIQHDKDWKVITLTSENHQLSCHNKNYLKLICSDDKIEFSLSMEKEGHRKISFNLVRLISDKVPVFMNSQFIRETKEKEFAELSDKQRPEAFAYHIEQYQGMLKRSQN